MTVVQTVRSLQSTCQVVIRHGVDIVERPMVGRRDKEEIKSGEERREQAGRVPTVTGPNARHCWLERDDYDTLGHMFVTTITITKGCKYIDGPPTSDVCGYIINMIVPRGGTLKYSAQPSCLVLESWIIELPFSLLFGHRQDDSLHTPRST